METRGLLLDVEGVLVADKRYQAVPSAVPFVHAARAAGCPLRLITNNTTDDRPAILAKLARAGFDFTLDELHTCTRAACQHLQQLAVRRCLVLGTPALQRLFSEAGFEIRTDAAVDAVIVGLDPEVTYAHLQGACEAILSHQAALIALHRNRLYTDASGRRAPSVGATVAALEYATQVTATVIGKPSRDYYQQVLDDLGVPAAEALIVSDDPLSDLAGAKRMGMHAAFVLSGKYPDDRVLASLPVHERPDLTVPAIGDLLTQHRVRFSPAP